MVMSDDNILTSGAEFKPPTDKFNPLVKLCVVTSSVPRAVFAS